jgi:WD40-like Beta Propeller Repeat
MRLAICLVVGCVWSACAGAGNDGGGGGDDDDDGPMVVGTLSISPPMTELLVLDDTPAHATFTAALKLSDGTTRDVTAETTFQVDPVCGSFAASQLTVVAAGRTQVVASYAGKTATAELTVRGKWMRFDATLSAAEMALLTVPPTSTAGPAPQIVYPALDTVMPRNLGDFEVHWKDSTNTVFEVSLRTELSEVVSYVRGGNGLASQGPNASWAAFRARDWLSAVGNQGAVVYQLRGATLANPGVVGVTLPRSVHLSSQAMEGGLYYWATATAATAIGVFRHDMAHPDQGIEEFLTTNKTSGTCIACHVLSRDGTKMAIVFQQNGTTPGPSTMVDVASRRLEPATKLWNFGTFTPDNAQFLSVQAGKLVVRDTATQAEIAMMPTTPANAKVTQPDLSADGKWLVYVRPNSADTDFEFEQGQIYIRSYDQSTRAFGEEIPLVNDGQNNFYPSWSPDGIWILFNRNQFGNAYDDGNTMAWVVKADRSQAPIPLARANEGLGLTNSWARWAPFAQNLSGNNEPMYWVTMSSKRDFGVRLRNSGLAQRARRAQLWMTPFFPERARNGTDPSTAAFRLPFQGFDSSNHLAQWTEKIVVID